MHIHSYQIHNVLNVYRKQLNQGILRLYRGGASLKRPNLDRINISIDEQRQSLFEKISSEIVDRITRCKAGARFECGLADQLCDTGGADSQKVAGADADGASQYNMTFTYTLIDEHNQKSTQRLPITELSIQPGGIAD